MYSRYLKKKILLIIDSIIFYEFMFYKNFEFYNIYVLIKINVYVILIKRINY